MITREQLAALCSQSDRWLAPLNTAMGAHWINTPSRVAMFLATCLYESGGFMRLAENLNYSADGLLRMWPALFDADAAAAYAHQPELIANRAYANRNGNGDEASGDGWRYRGRGLIQLTGKRNFMRAEAASGLDLLDRPELLEQPMPAADTAAWFWADAGLNALADAGDFDGTQGAINRGNRSKVADNLDARRAWLRKVQSALA